MHFHHLVFRQWVACDILNHHEEAGHLRRLQLFQDLTPDREHPPAHWKSFELESLLGEAPAYCQWSKPSGTALSKRTRSWRMNYQRRMQP
jgi:hypothetical protein